MPESLDEFRRSPAAVPLRESAASGVSARSMPTMRAVAAVLGISRTELIRARRRPLDRAVFVQTADAAPDSVQPTLIAVTAGQITPNGMTFVHRSEFPLRRLIVSIAAPTDDAPGCGGSFVATVIGAEQRPDGLAETYVRFQSVASLDEPATL